MDIVSIGVAVELAKKTVLPQASSGDAGSQLIVDENGKWAKGEPITAAISVSGTTLTITGGD